MRKLTLDDLNVAVKLGGASTLSERTELMPAAGMEGIVAPAKYAGSSASAYVFEDRFIPNDPAEGLEISSAQCRRVVLIDSRTSQSNRAEAYIAQASEDETSIYSKMPRIRVTYNATDDAGNPMKRIVDDVTLPHRAFDAHIRVGEIEGKRASQHPDYIAARNATTANLMPLFKLSPVTVAFGAWDSTRSKNQLRLASPYNGEIIGVLANQAADNPVHRAGARIDPIDASIKFDKTGAKKIAEAIAGDISSGTRKTFEGKGAGSTIGLGAIPPSVDDKHLDGIAVSRIIRTHVLSFATLRSLRFGKGREGDEAIRALIAAMIIDAMTGSNAELNLRANCMLRESAAPVTILDKRFGTYDEIEPLTLDDTTALLEQAYAQAQEKAGLDWHGRILEVTGNPLVIKSASADDSDQ